MRFVTFAAISWAAHLGIVLLSGGAVIAECSGTVQGCKVMLAANPCTGGCEEEAGFCVLMADDTSIDYASRKKNNKTGTFPACAVTGIGTCTKELRARGFIEYYALSNCEGDPLLCYDALYSYCGATDASGPCPPIGP
jgi:hypothetical protein